MADHRVSVTLSFKTDSPPAALAMTVGHVVAQHVADPLAAIHWDTYDLDEDEEGESR
ncbi:hypothetical protein [Nocardiopsis sp. YSL2]|uniref:hypothetical protein n=1 Tax=Nocardiopsis sp. YSL2 TaxID=2939492 RepID=UPI0026F4150A|nr:hypothetical protein [Nocardiopsis sp. YSL2]